MTEKHKLNIKKAPIKIKEEEHNETYVEEANEEENLGSFEINVNEDNGEENEGLEENEEELIEPVRNSVSRNQQRKRTVPKLESYNDMEEEYEKLNKGGIKKIIIIVLAVLTLIGVSIGITYFTVSKLSKQNTKQTTTDTAKTTVVQTTATTLTPTSLLWPSDVTAGNLEIRTDSKNEPVFFLTGTKKGLGSVVREYDKTGKLVGFWVIVDDGSQSTGSTNTTSQATTNNTTQQTTIPTTKTNTPNTTTTQTNTAATTTPATNQQTTTNNTQIPTVSGGTTQPTNTTK